MYETNHLNNLEMSKKRDHKIWITDEAIEKVPLICYKEIPEKEYDTIRELIKEVLRISKNRNNSNEVAITYSLDSEFLISTGAEYVGITLGDEHNVDPLSTTVAYHLVMTSSDCVIISLHNHPSLSKFSLQDVQFLIMYASVKMMCVVINLGNVSYLVKNKKYDRSIAMDILREAVKLHNDANELKGYQKAAKYFLKNCHKAGIIYED